MNQSSNVEQPSARQYTHNEILIVISGLMLGMLLAALDQTIVATALTTIVSELHGSSHLSWVVTAYMLSSTAAAPLYGKVGDLYGRKRLFLFAIIVFLVGSMLCGISQNIEQLIAFRAIQGFGAGGLFTLSMAIVGDIVPARERGRYQGYFGAVFGLSSVIGPLLGGFLTDSWSWRWVFYINIPLGAIAVTFIAFKLHLPKHRTEHRIDYLGALFLTTGVVAFLLGLVWGGGHASSTTSVNGQTVQIPFTGYPWGSFEIIGLFITAVLFFSLFIAQELRHEEPIIPMGLFRDQVFSISVAMSFITGAAMFGAIVYIPQFMQVIKGISPTDSGLLMIPMTIGIVTTSILSGRYVSKHGRYRKFPIIGTLVIAIGFGLLSTITIDINQALLSIYMVIIGAGIGCFMQIPVIAVQNSVAVRNLGSATAALLFFRTLGGSVGTAIFGVIVNNQLRSELPKYVGQASNLVNLDRLQHGIIERYGPVIAHGVYASYTHALHIAFLLGVPMALLAFVFSLFLPHKPLQTQTMARDKPELEVQE